MLINLNEVVVFQIQDVTQVLAFWLQSIGSGQVFMRARLAGHHSLHKSGRQPGICAEGRWPHRQAEDLYTLGDYWPRLIWEAVMRCVCRLVIRTILWNRQQRLAVGKGADI